MFRDINFDKYNINIYLFCNLSNYYKLPQSDAVTGKVLNSDKSPSPLCTGVNPQRPVRKAATAEGGSGASIPAASSPPILAEVMKIASLTCAVRCTVKGRGLMTKAAKPTLGDDDVIDEGMNAQAFLSAVASLLLHYFPKKMVQLTILRCKNWRSWA